MRVTVEIVLQTVLAFFSILFITRILGRQQVSQLTLQEYITGITFGSIAGTLATDMNQRTWHHLIGLFLFGILTFLISFIGVKNIKFARMIQGEPVLVIKDGKVLEKNLEKFHYTIDDLNHLLRNKDIFDISHVQYGILETTGEINVIKNSLQENLKTGDIGINVAQQHLRSEVVVTGTIIYQTLQQRNLSARWLIDQLKQRNIKDIKEVFYATLDQDNNLYIDTMEDQLNN
jgi:uncharacterized membrane protein YcaP (DUF421 family)